MAFIRVKRFENRTYKYLVKNVRIDGKVRQKVVKYLGASNPIYKIKRNRKTNASIFARKLNEEEKRELKIAAKSSNSFIRDRAKIILLSSEGLFSRQIAEKIDCEERKVRAAIKSFNQEGLNALQRKKAKGAKPKFSKEEEFALLLHFSKEPRKFGIPISTWTLPKFRKHLIEKDVVSSISIEKIRQILLQAGAKLTKSKRWQYSPDKNFLKRKKL